MFKYKNLCIACMLLVCGSSLAQEIVAVVSKDNTVAEMPIADLKNYYRGKIAVLGGSQVNLFYIDENDPAGKALFAELGVSQAAFENMWNEIKLSGKSNVSITKVANEAELIEKVSGNKANLGVVSKSVMTRGNMSKVNFLK